MRNASTLDATLGFPVIMMTMVPGRASSTALRISMPEHRRHVEIAEHDIEVRATNEIERFVAAANRRDIVSLNAENARASLSQRPIIVDDEDANRGAHFPRNAGGIRGAAVFGLNRQFPASQTFA